MKSGARRIRVLYVIGKLGIGGAEGHLLQVVRHLDRERFEPMLACLSDLGPLADDFRRAGVEPHLYGLKGFPAKPLREKLRDLSGIAAYARSRRPDIVHTYLYEANVIGGLMSRLGGAPVLVTSRRGLGLFKDGRPYFQWAENLVNLFSAAITVNSRQVEQDVLRRERFAAGKTRLIYNGVEAERFAAPQRAPAEVRAGLGIPAGAPVVGCIANLIPYKGHAELLEAMARVDREVPGAHLVLVGRDDGIQTDLARRADELGLGGRVHFAGSRRDIADLLHAFDLQVLASHEEGFSNVILEGMAAGRPVIATAVGGNPEAVLHGQTGLIVPPKSPGALAEALLELLRRPGLARSMGEAGRHRVLTEFSVPAMIGKLESLYAELQGQRRSHQPKG